ncbi:MAG: O-antigen ligase family protein [Terriglobia bacterium]
MNGTLLYDNRRAAQRAAPGSNDAHRPVELRQMQPRVDALQKFLWGALIVSFPFTALELWPSHLKTFGQPTVLIAAALGALVLGDAVLRPTSIFVPKGRSAWLLLGLMTIISLSFFIRHPMNPYMWPGHNPTTKSLKQIVQWLVDGWIVYLTLRFVRTWKDFRFALTCLFLGFVCTAGSALMNLGMDRWPAGHMASLFRLLHSGAWPVPSSRLTLLAYEPSMAGDYLLTVVPLLVCGVFYWKFPRWSIFWSTVALVLFCGTLSFGCFGALFAAAVIVGVAYARRGSKGLLVGMLLLAAVLAAAAVSSSKGEEFIGDRLTELVENGFDPSAIPSFSTRQRLASAEAAFNIFSEYPFTGVGVGKSAFYMYHAFPVWALNQGDIASSSFGSYSPDTAISFNLFVQMLAETGVVGTAIFLALLLSMMADCYGAMNSAKERWKRAAFAGILFALVAQIIHYNAMSWLGMRYWFFIWGLAMCAPRLLKQKDPKVPERRTAVRKVPAGRHAF